MIRLITLAMVSVCVMSVSAHCAWAATATLEGQIRKGRDAGLEPGALRISRIAFEVTAGTTVVFDALAWEDDTDLNQDGHITAFDSEMSLLDDSGKRLAVNDDYSGLLDENGSVTSLDSLIHYTFDKPGEYRLALGQVLHSPFEAYQGYRADTAPWNFGNRIGLHGRSICDGAAATSPTSGCLMTVRTSLRLPAWS